MAWTAPKKFQKKGTIAPASKSNFLSKWKRYLIFILIGCWVFLQWKTNIWSSMVHDTYVSEGQQRQQQQPPVSFSESRPPLVSVSNDSMSACLLVMDDNPRLVEWLAYHYYTTQLRYLIVAVDPRSTMSPKDILDRWTLQQQQGTAFYYEIWKDDDYMGARVLNKREKLDQLGRQDLTIVHRVRQKAFYQFCLEHLEAHHRNTWTLMIDVDEYLVVNKNEEEEEEGQQQQQQQSAKDVMSKPGGVYEFVKETALAARKDPSNPHYEQFAGPCVTIPRLLFGTKQDKGDEAIMNDFDGLGNSLDTVQWFYHANYSEFDRNGLGKTILDLSRIEIPKPHFPHPVNPHRPFQDICRDPKRIVALNQHALLRVHHYLSTWETYSYRNDSRRGGERSREAWEFRAISDAGGKTMDIVPWLQGFVQYFGKEQASKLLQGAGLPKHYTHPPVVNDQWKFLFLEDFLDGNVDKKVAQSKFGQFLQNRTAAKGGGYGG